jgi:hypothetical protein
VPRYPPPPGSGDRRADGGPSPPARPLRRALCARNPDSARGFWGAESGSGAQGRTGGGSGAPTTSTTLACVLPVRAWTGCGGGASMPGTMRRPGRVKSDDFRRLARNPAILWAGTLTDRDIFPDPDAGCPRRARVRRDGAVPVQRLYLLRVRPCAVRGPLPGGTRPPSGCWTMASQPNPVPGTARSWTPRRPSPGRRSPSAPSMSPRCAGRAGRPQIADLIHAFAFFS